MLTNHTQALIDYERQFFEPPKSEEERWEEYQEKQDWLETEADARFEEMRIRNE